MLELNKVHCGDSKELLKQIDSNQIALSVCSPPYDNIRDYKGYSFDFEAIANELYRVLQHGGTACWIVGDAVIKGGETLTSFKQAIYFQKLGFLQDTLIYQKKNFAHPEKIRYHSVFEYIFVLSKGKQKVFNPIKDRKNMTAGSIGNFGVNTFTKKDGSKSVRAKKVVSEYGMRHNVWLGLTRGQELAGAKSCHPAMSPNWLVSDLIKSYSNEGDSVLDCFSGSGTTLIQAKKLKRNYIGIDSSQEYCEMAIEELEKI